MTISKARKLLIGTFFIGATQLFAATITIHNTGTANGSGNDSFWTLTGAPAGTGYTTAVVITNASSIYPASSLPGVGGVGSTPVSWITGGGTGGGWIGPEAQMGAYCTGGALAGTNCAFNSSIPNAATQHTQVGNGDYFYTTTFNATGFDFTTIALSGLWAADGSGISIFINGKSTSTTMITNTNPSNLGSGGSYAVLTAFSITNSTCAGGCFQSGVNSLTFEVQNGKAIAGNTAGETGLRVDFTSSTASTVPEPSSFFVLASGLGLLGALRRRR